ncbi:hypothetical protein [Nostoc flagelliforme]|uniref:hypothetical protein n=1 Tax=Nostoc flagelliforme TaxID=1306274 RepID=UPI000C2D2B96
MTLIYAANQPSVEVGEQGAFQQGTDTGGALIFLFCCYPPRQGERGNFSCKVTPSLLPLLVISLSTAINELPFLQAIPTDETWESTFR